jgi:predicted phage tail protein
MLTLRFAGYMSDLFGFDHQFDCRTVEELFRAIRANFPDFAEYLTDAAARGLHYQISVDGRLLPLHALGFLLPESALISIVAVPCGAGGNGFRIIAGVALLGLGLAGVGFLGFKAGTVAITGAALLLGALAGRQRTPKDEKGQRSFMFGGPTTSNKEGDAMPVGYGLHLYGWLLASQRITSTYKAA